MSWLSTNLQVLVQRWPGWQQPWGSSPDCPEFEPKQSASGLPTGLYRGTALHSTYDPQKEAERIGAGLTEPQALILGGFALGYQAEVLRKKFPQAPLLVVEPDPGLFAQALTLRNLRSLLQDPLVNLMVGAQPQAVAAFLESLEGRSPTYLPYRPQEVLQREYFQQLACEITAWGQMKEVNRNTRKKFMGRWSTNFLGNWGNLRHLRPLGELQGKLKGLPGVIAAAGPSLEGCLDQIRTHRKSLVLVAVDTAYGRLLDEGLTPDFLVSTDAQYWNSRHLDRLRPPYPFLVGEMTSPPALWRGRPDRGLLADSAVPLFRDLGTLWDRNLGLLPSGGSVATTAWSAARLLGLEPLIFAGLDLAFPREETHIRGSTFEELHHCRSTRLHPAQTSLGRQGDAAGKLRRPDWYGEWVSTDVRMDLYRRWFETQVASSKGPPPYILRPKGQRIQGFQILEDLESLPNFQPGNVGDISQRISFPILNLPVLGQPAGAKKFQELLGNEEGLKSVFKNSWKSCVSQFGIGAEEEWARETNVLRNRWNP